MGVDEVLELTGASEIADQRTQKLSGGQTQRVRFAVALVSNPQLLVLDEPTVAMDVEGRHAFWTTMREFAARGTDDRVRDPLPRGGRRLCRPRRADGARAASSPTGRRRRSRRWWGRARSARRSRRRCRRRSAGCAGVQAAERHGEAVIAELQRFRRGDQGAAGRSSGGARYRDRGGRSRAGVPRADRR